MILGLPEWFYLLKYGQNESDDIIQTSSKFHAMVLDTSHQIVNYLLIWIFRNFLKAAQKKARIRPRKGKKTI